MTYNNRAKIWPLLVAVIGLTMACGYAAPTALDPGGGQAVQAVANGTGTATDMNIITAFDLDSNATAITSTPSDAFAQNNTANKTMAVVINASLPSKAAFTPRAENAQVNQSDVTAPTFNQAGFGPELATATAITANTPTDVAQVNLANEITAMTYTSASKNTTTLNGETDASMTNTTPQALAVDVTACARSCPNFAATFTANITPAEVSIAPTGGGSFGALIVATGPTTGSAYTG